MCFGGDAITVIIPAADRTVLEACLQHATAAADHTRSRGQDVSILVVDYAGAAATDWVEDAFLNVYCCGTRSPQPRERAVNAAVQLACCQRVPSAVLILDARALIGPELLTDLHRTVHSASRLGLIRIRPDDGEPLDDAAVPERGALALSIRTRQPGVIELLRESPAAAVLLRRDMIEHIGGFDPAHETGLAVADLVRRAHLDGWTTAWHTAPGLHPDPTSPHEATRRLRDELDLIACDPALTWAGAFLLTQAWLSRHDRADRWPGVAGALAALVWRLPRLVRRRRQHRALALATALHDGRLALPRGWNPLRPGTIGTERQT